MLTRIVCCCLFLLQLFSGYAQDTTTVATAIPVIEKRAQFPGGVAVWENFLRRNAVPTAIVEGNIPYGKYSLLIEFKVNKDGSLSDIKPLTNYGFGMEEEMMSLIKNSGTWEPALLKDGSPTEAIIKQPFTFVNQRDEEEVRTTVPYKLFRGKDNYVIIKARKVNADNLKVTASGNTQIEYLGQSNYIISILDNAATVTITLMNARKNKVLSTYIYDVKDAADISK